LSPDAVDANGPGYDEVLVKLKARVRQARYVARRRVNTELVQLYWQLGTTLAEQTEQQAWGSGGVKRLADDLRAEFPEMKGFSPQNLIYMRSFARAWPDGEIAQRPVAQLPWGHITTLLDRVADGETRDWYVSQDGAP
jgi:predicted nuclease of restriction endonuclease-like (RecB) superfamily